MIKPVHMSRLLRTRTVSPWRRAAGLSSLPASSGSVGMMGRLARRLWAADGCCVTQYATEPFALTEVCDDSIANCLSFAFPELSLFFELLLFFEERSLFYGNVFNFNSCGYDYRPCSFESGRPGAGGQLLS